MNVLILSLLAVVSTATPSSDQKPAGNPARISACTILTRDVVDKVKVANKTKLNTPPQESPVGLNGSYCDYGGIGLQIDPFAGADRLRKAPEKNWVPVSGVGDTAYFYNVRDIYAEMIVWSGSHHFAIQMEAPIGGTAEQLKPNTIQLATLIIPKLK